MQSVPAVISALALLVSLASLILTMYFQHYRRRLVVCASFRSWLEPGPDFDGEPIPGGWAYSTEYFAHFMFSNDGNRDVVVTDASFQIWRRDEKTNTTSAFGGSTPLETPVKVAASEVEIVKFCFRFGAALRTAHAEIASGSSFAKFKARASIKLIGPQNIVIEKSIDGEMIQRGDETILAFPNGGSFDRIAITLPLVSK